MLLVPFFAFISLVKSGSSSVKINHHLETPMFVFRDAPIPIPIIGLELVGIGIGQNWNWCIPICFKLIILKENFH
jgi:hypothetical protein